MENMNIGDRLRILIEEKGVTPYEVSKMTGISQATLSRILNNTTAKMNIHNLTLLSEYFNVSYDWLSTGKGEKRVYYSSHYPKTPVASDYIAAYRSDDSLIDSHNRLARAMETIAESNKVLAENNKRVTENNEKVINEMLRVVKNLEGAKKSGGE